MKFLVILVNIVLTINALADDNLSQDNSGDVIPLVISGAATAATATGSYMANRNANNLQNSITENQANIAGAERYLPDLEQRVRQTESISPEQLAKKEFRVYEPLPHGMGQAAQHANYFQEYIDDPVLAKKANEILEKMKARVAGATSSRNNLSRILELRNSALEQEYQNIIEEAKNKGLIKTRPAPLVRAQFEYMDDAKSTINALLVREDFKHRGFVDEAGHAVKGKTEFVLRLKKSYSPSIITTLRGKMIANAQARLHQQTTAIENFKAQNAKAEKDIPRFRKLSKVGRYATGGGVVATLGIGWLLSSSTSVDTQLLEETNPRPISVEDPVPTLPSQASK